LEINQTKSTGGLPVTRGLQQLNPKDFGPSDSFALLTAGLSNAFSVLLERGRFRDGVFSKIEFIFLG
jgi:hypothetical protein